MSGVYYQGGVRGRKPSGSFAFAGAGAAPTGNVAQATVFAHRAYQKYFPAGRVTRWQVRGGPSPLELHGYQKFTSAQYVVGRGRRVFGQAPTAPAAFTTIVGRIGVRGSNSALVGMDLGSCSFLIGAGGSVTLSQAISRSVAGRMGFAGSVSTIQKGYIVSQTAALGGVSTQKHSGAVVGHTAGVRMLTLTTVADSTTLFSSVEGILQALGVTSYTKNSRPSVVSRTGVLGSMTTLAGAASRISTVSGRSGARGSNSTVKQLSTSSDLLSAIVELDKNGTPLSLLTILQAIIAILAARTEGFDDRGSENPREFKSLDGTKTRVRSNTRQGGQRTGDPDIFED